MNYVQCCYAVGIYPLNYLALVTGAIHCMFQFFKKRCNYYVVFLYINICFKRKNLKISSPTFFLDQSKIPFVEQCRYLGTTILIKNSDLDLKRQMRKMYANANSLLRKFSRCSVNVKCYLFKTYCSNLYCAPMWFDCTKTVLTKLKVAYINSLRRFMGLPWHNSASEMFVNLNIKSFGELL